MRSADPNLRQIRRVVTRRVSSVKLGQITLQITIRCGDSDWDMPKGEHDCYPYAPGFSNVMNVPQLKQAWKTLFKQLGCEHELIRQYVYGTAH